MAIHRAKVIGQLKVCDVAPGGIVELDDEKVNLAALLAGENVELLPVPKPAKGKSDKAGV